MAVRRVSHGRSPTEGEQLRWTRGLADYDPSKRATLEIHDDHGPGVRGDGPKLLVADNVAAQKRTYPSPFLTSVSSVRTPSEHATVQPRFQVLPIAPLGGSDCVEFDPDCSTPAQHPVDALEHDDDPVGLYPGFERHPAALRFGVSASTLVHASGDAETHTSP